MKVDTLTGPNLSYHVAVLEKFDNVHIEECVCYYEIQDEGFIKFDCLNPFECMLIAERERISCVDMNDGKGGFFWNASTICKVTRENERYKHRINSEGSTMAEAMMRCYVKSYLGDDTKEQP